MSLKIKSVPQLIDLIRNEKITFKKATELSSTLSVTDACDLATAAQMTGGSGFVDAGLEDQFYKTSVITKGNIIYTDILMDITGLTSAATLGDIIGVDDAPNCHFGQITAAINGTIVGGTMTCLETPAGGEPDIDIYSATVGTGTENTAIGDLTETAVLNASADWQIGTVNAAGTIKAFSGIPDNGYLYLTVGTNSTPTAGTYTAGRFIIQMWGYAA